MAKENLAKMIKKRLAGLIVGAAIALTGYSSFYTVDQTQQAIVTQFGNPVRVILNSQETKDSEQRTKEIKDRYQQLGILVGEGAGLRFKIPYIQKVTKFDKRLLRWN